MYNKFEYEMGKIYDQKKEIPVEMIVKYILETYKDSCFKSNWENGWKERWSNEEILEEAYDLFRYEILCWCGCGCVVASDAAVYKFLYASLSENAWKKREEILEEYFGTGSIYDNILLLCLAYSIDAAGFTEHGTSIGGAWTDDKGKIFMYLLEKKYGKRALLDKEWH